MSTEIDQILKTKNKVRHINAQKIRKSGYDCRTQGKDVERIEC